MTSDRMLHRVDSFLSFICLFGKDELFACLPTPHQHIHTSWGEDGREFFLFFFSLSNRAYRVSKRKSYGRFIACHTSSFGGRCCYCPRTFPRPATRDAATFLFRKGSWQPKFE